MTPRRPRTPLLLLLALALAGCPKKDEPPKSEPSKKEEASSKSKSKEGDEGKKKKDDDDPKSKDDDKDDKDDDDDGKDKDDQASNHTPTPMPERTKVPTVAEWNAAADAKASGNDRGCEIRTVREWVRVSCRKPGPDGSMPSGVIVTRGKTKETYLYKNTGVTSIVTPLLPGTDLQAKYSWTDKVYSVSIRWGKTEPQPEVVAHFAETDDKPTALTGDATCACMKKTHPGSQCNEQDENWQITSVNPWCEDTYGDDCQKLVECARGEPGRLPKCPDGFQVMYPGNSCVQKCTGKCPDGYDCVEFPYDAKIKVCMEK